MSIKDTKFDFDLSVLTLEELIRVYENVDEFITFLESKKIEIESKETDEK